MKDVLKEDFIVVGSVCSIAILFMGYGGVALLRKLRDKQSRLYWLLS